MGTIVPILAFPAPSTMAGMRTAPAAGCSNCAFASPGVRSYDGKQPPGVMIFAELEYQKHYSDVHAELLAFVDKRFSRVQSGLQGDSWIWILDGDEKVAIDTFTSMKHQIKSAKAGAHVRKVIETLLRQFEMKVYEEPEPEAHEDARS
jgi:hypothetical protein